MLLFEFYTGDIAGHYLILMEGITQEGISFTAKDSFLSQKIKEILKFIINTLKK